MSWATPVFFRSSRRPTALGAVALLINAAGPSPRIIPAAPAPATAIDERPQVSQSGPAHWDELLECAREHSQDCLRLIRESSKSKSCDHLQDLAQVLLAEWKLSGDEEILRRPREVWIRRPTLNEVEEGLPTPFEASLVIVSGVVDKRGFVHSAEVVRPGSYPAIAQLVLEAFRRARYRPARRGNAYVEETVRLSYRLEPH